MTDGLPWESGWSPDSWSPVPPSMTWARWGSHQPGQGVHTFVDDRRLVPILRGRFGGLGQGRIWATEPDFSILGGMPEPVIRWQVYRARWGGDLLRRRGLQVVPVLQWAGADSWDLCAWGIRSGSAVACRAPGRDLDERAAWAAGFLALVERIQPSAVLCFGVFSRVRGTLQGAGVPWVGLPLWAGRSTTVGMCGDRWGRSMLRGGEVQCM